MAGVMSSVTTNVFVALALTGVFYIMKQASQPRGIRNNNPLNIRKSPIRWRGAVGDDGEFVQFSTALLGIRAAARNLRTYREKYGYMRIADIINRWAPDSENDTESYISSVEKLTGLRRYQILKMDEYPALIAAMIYHENGKQPYDEEVIQQGFNLGFEV
jgi:hypothetical protein